MANRGKRAIRLPKRDDFKYLKQRLTNQLSTFTASSDGRFFLSVFAASSFISHPVGGGGSNGNVEQWMNLTNSMFEGSRDFLFSYGPLYWLTGGVAAPYNFGTWLLSIFFTSVIQAVYWTLLWRLRSRNTWPQLVIGLGIILAAQGVFPSSTFYMWPVLLLPLLAEKRIFDANRFGLLPIVIGLYVGLALYIRFFFGVIALLAFLIWLAFEAKANRRYKPLGAFLLASFLSYILIGLAIFRDATSLVRYVLFNSQLSFGNAVDMTYDVQTNWAVFSCFIGLFLVVLWRLRRSISMLVAVAAVELILFKLGYGRADHVATYLIPTVPVLLLLSGSLATKSRHLMSIIPLALLITVAVTPNYPGAYTLQFVKDLATLQAPYGERMGQMYSRFALDSETKTKISKSTVDVYPYYNEVAFANGLNYTPRPSFQSYMTLTPALGQANVEFFQSSKAPVFVIWTAGAACPSPSCSLFEAFDEKYVLNEDPLTSSAIMDSYHEVSRGSLASGLPFVLLERNAATHAKPAESTSEELRGRLGDWLTVPAAGTNRRVMLFADLKLTPIANVKNTVFRGNTARITYRLIDGSERTHRLNILNARAGIWATPYLVSSYIDGIEVTGIRLDCAEWYMSNGFKYEWKFTSR